MGGVLTALFLSISLIFFSCSNGSSGSDGNALIIPIAPANPDDNSSNNENNNEWNEMIASMPADKEMAGFGAPTVDETETEGIRFNFIVPESKSSECQYFVIIDGLGYAYEDICDSGSVQSFLYPFVDGGKTYKVFIRFMYETTNAEGFTEQAVMGWKTFEVTPKGGKGESVIVRNPEFSCDENGNLVITPPVFSNESAVSNHYARIGIVSGTYSSGKQKWIGELILKHDELAKPHNLYTDGVFWINNMPINTLDYHAKINYTDSKGKAWEYRLSGANIETLDLPSPDSMWTLATDEQKNGTWKRSWSYDDKVEISEGNKIAAVCVQTHIITINGSDISRTRTYVYSKKDGSAYTEAEKADKLKGKPFSADSKTFTDTNTDLDDEDKAKINAAKVFKENDRMLMIDNDIFTKQ